MMVLLSDARRRMASPASVKMSLFPLRAEGKPLTFGPFSALEIMVSNIARA